jgi:hypothetical protein
MHLILDEPPVSASMWRLDTDPIPAHHETKGGLAMNRLLLGAAALLFLSPCSASTGFWSYFLNLLPPLWEQNDFTFGPSGAFAEFGAFWYPDSSGTDSEFSHIVSEEVMVPSGIDSILIVTSQFVDLEAGCSTQGFASTYAKLWVYINGAPTLLWSIQASASMGESDHERSNSPIFVFLPPVSAGDVIQLRYSLGGGGYMGISEGSWLLWDAKLVGCSSYYSLTPLTWGCIKTVF